MMEPKMMGPKVSVIMPVLNGKRYIAEAIQSIWSQQHDNIELIVVDDGSTDETAEIVKSLSAGRDVKYVRHASAAGIAPSMNDGIRHSSGELISFLDHDDVWCPEFLETQVAYLAAHTDVAMVHSDFETMDAEGNTITPSVAAWRGKTRPSGSVFGELFMDSFIVGNSVLIRRECFDRLGLFDETLRWGDYHMWMRIARHYRVDYVPKVLTKYRQHSTQSTRTISAKVAVHDPVALQAIKKVLEAHPEVWQELGSRKIRRRMATMYFDAAQTWWSARIFSNARICLAKAIRLDPGKAKYYLQYMATLLGPSLAMAAVAIWRRVHMVGSVDSVTSANTGAEVGR
jgi:glycosyltransferase involved in cell wall biosynthesis